MKTTQTYYILSGEGTGSGTWSGPYVTTERGARQRAARERCAGDRWASVFELVPESLTMFAHVVDIDTGTADDVPDMA